jgi:hypothetical protein
MAEMRCQMSRFSRLPGLPGGTGTKKRRAHARGPIDRCERLWRAGESGWTFFFVSRYIPNSGSEHESGR